MPIKINNPLTEQFTKTIPLVQMNPNEPWNTKFNKNNKIKSNTEAEKCELKGN